LCSFSQSEEEGEKRNGTKKAKSPQAQMPRECAPVQRHSIFPSVLAQRFDDWWPDSSSDQLDSLVSSIRSARIAVRLFFINNMIDPQQRFPQIHDRGRVMPSIPEGKRVLDPNEPCFLPEMQREIQVFGIHIHGFESWCAFAFY